MTSCLAPVLEGVPDNFHVVGLLHSLAQSPMFDLMTLKSFLSNLIQGPNPKLVDGPYKHKV
jgi:hypothetical protein